jgi:hypothetical protein
MMIAETTFLVVPFELARPMSPGSVPDAAQMAQGKHADWPEWRKTVSNCHLFAPLTGFHTPGTLPAPMLCQAVPVATLSAVPAPVVCGLGIELILILPV